MLELEEWLFMLRTMRSDQLVNAQGLREQLGSHLTDWKLARFRKSKLIPYVPLGDQPASQANVLTPLANPIEVLVPLAKKITRAGMVYREFWRSGNVAIYCAKGLEAQSAQVQLWILSNGFVTEEAKRLFAELPMIVSLISPIKIEEITVLLEGKNLNSQQFLGEL